jgi:hypothetical protein
VDIIASLPTSAERTKLVQPRQRALYYPAPLAQATAMGSIAASQHRKDLVFQEPAAMRIGGIAAIPLHGVRLAPRPSSFPPPGRNRLPQRLKLREIVSISSGQTHRQRDAIGIREHGVFAARLGSIRGIGASLRPPKTARTLARSTTARDQSMISASCRRASSTSRSFSQTPAAGHSPRRRQQVLPQPHPISWGSISQGIPVRSTNKMPVSACRLGAGGRPPFGLGFSAGKTGSISFPNSSLNSDLAIGIPSARKCLRFHFHSNASKESC